MRRNYIPTDFEMIALVLAIVGVIVGGIVLGNQDKVNCQNAGGKFVSGMVGDEYVMMCAK